MADSLKTIFFESVSLTENFGFKIKFHEKCFSRPIDRQQAITWCYIHPDHWRHLASLGPNELETITSLKIDLIKRVEFTRTLSPLNDKAN